MKIILAQGIENPVLLDQYMMGTELEVDGICDGEDVLIPGIMEHIERTGVHSGDSIAVYPSWNLNDVLREKIMGIYHKNVRAREMTRYEKEALTQYYKDYKAMDGNSYIDRYYNRMLEWNIVEDDYEE